MNCKTKPCENWFSTNYFSTSHWLLLLKLNHSKLPNHSLTAMKHKQFQCMGFKWHHSNLNLFSSLMDWFLYMVVICVFSSMPLYGLNVLIKNNTSMLLTELSSTQGTDSSEFTDSVFIGWTPLSPYLPLKGNREFL